MLTEEKSLAILSDATRMLAQVKDAAGAKKIMDLASAAEHFARKSRMGEEAIGYAHAIKIDAQTMLGEFLRKNPPQVGARGTGSNQHKKMVKYQNSISPPLSVIGITAKESAHAQKLAKIKENAPEQHAAVRERATTVVAVIREERESKREERRVENAVKALTTDDVLTAGAKFSCILADPPWDWRDEGDVNQLGRAKPDYATMPIAALLALPIQALADTDCHIYLWSTNRSLPKAFGLIERWGFRYVTMLTWPKPSMGMGNYHRGQTEHVLFGVRGSLALKRKDASTLLPTWARGPRGHSSKPIEFYGFMESCSPGPYLELFAREKHSGWSAWGPDA